MYKNTMKKLCYTIFFYVGVALFSIFLGNNFMKRCDCEWITRQNSEFNGGDDKYLCTGMSGI